MFDFVDDTLDYLKNIKRDLDFCSDMIENFFNDMLENSCEGYFNISSRVKSPSSLKEKIIRHNYYLNYSNGKELMGNLSDLIGVRLECRFVEDEVSLFNYIETMFSNKTSEGFSYCSRNNSIFLDLREEQPLSQKNGFKLYRIDGFILHKQEKFNFELQIKSMVNLFWGEIEHKVIYKNYNMFFGDDFYRNILNSIKTSLSLIDNQLLTIYNHMSKMNNNGSSLSLSKQNLELLLSKLIYDLYSRKVKDELGISLDFRNGCDIIIDYIFAKNNCTIPEEYYNTFISTALRVNEIIHDNISFKSTIQLNEHMEFSSAFSKRIGSHLYTTMNKDFHWNLFFKILFHIEPENADKDFKNFINYLESLFGNRDSYLNLYLKFDKDQVDIIKESILSTISHAFVDIGSIKFIYRDKLQQIYSELDSFIVFIMDDVKDFDNFDNYDHFYMSYLYTKLLAIFNGVVSIEFLENISSYSTHDDFNFILTPRGKQLLLSTNKPNKLSAEKALNYILIP